MFTKKVLQEVYTNFGRAEEFIRDKNEEICCHENFMKECDSF